MSGDQDLDDALGQLGLPEGSAPRSDAAAILSRARTLSPPATQPRRWAPARGGALLAAGVLIGVVAGRATAPTAPATAQPTPGVVVAPSPIPATPIEPAPPPLPAPPLVQAPAPAVAEAPARRRVGHPVAIPRSDSEDRAPASPSVAQLGSAPLAIPLDCAAMLGDKPREEAVGPTASPPVAPPHEPTLAELLDEEDPVPALSDDVFDSTPDVAGPGDRRLQRPERTALVGEAVEDPAPEAEAAPRLQRGPSPFVVRVVSLAGGGTGGGGGGAVLGGLAWRPEAGAVQPEVTADVGVGAWSEPSGLGWAFATRIGAGMLIGEGVVHGAADWTASALVPLEPREGPGEHDASPFATGPALALVVGREDRLHVRGGAYLDFSPMGPQDGPGAWQLRPTGFLALELPLGPDS